MKKTILGVLVLMLGFSQAFSQADFFKFFKCGKHYKVFCIYHKKQLNEIVLFL